MLTRRGPGGSPEFRLQELQDSPQFNEQTIPKNFSCSHCLLSRVAEADLRVFQVIHSELGRRKHDDTGLRTRHSTHARRSLRSATNGASRLRYAGWNPEPNQEWGGDYDTRSESAQSRAREGHSCDLLSTHVFAEGAHGRVPNEDGYGVAAGRNG